MQVETPTNKSKSNLLINVGALILQHKNDIFKKYEKKELIGEGSFGKVYKVECLQNNQLRALKIMNKKQSGLMNKLPEIENMKKLDHPNILNVYECAEDENNIYIVSQLCEGQELFNEIHNRITKQELFTETQIRVIMRQLLSAIGYAHSKKIVHRDIKPENILIEPDLNSYHITIIDWGLSRDLTNIPLLKQRIGTVDYAAPEVLKNEAYDHKCDIWSAGVIFYILLSGETPFPGRNTCEIERRIVSSQMINTTQKIWKSISPEAQDLLNKMLDRNQNSRISAQEALDHPWMKIKISTAGQVQDEFVKCRLQKLSKFCCQSKLVQATIHLMLQHFMTNQKQQELRQMFATLDTNGDGKLSLEELVEALQDQDDEEIKQIFAQVDTDKSVEGFIDYTEFLAASVDLRKLASRQKIQEAFSLFDQDGNGFISTEEIKELLGNKLSTEDEESLQNLVDEMDSNQDGQISFEEFYGMIQRFIQTTISSQLGSQEVDYYDKVISQLKEDEIIDKLQQEAWDQQNLQDRYNDKKTPDLDSCHYLPQIQDEELLKSPKQSPLMEPQISGEKKCATQNKGSSRKKAGVESLQSNPKLPQSLETPKKEEEKQKIATKEEIPQFENKMKKTKSSKAQNKQEQMIKMVQSCIISKEQPKTENGKKNKKASVQMQKSEIINPSQKIATSQRQMRSSQIVEPQYQKKVQQRQISVKVPEPKKKVKVEEPARYNLRAKPQK